MNKDDLLQQLADLGYDPVSGRKSRSDKGQRRSNYCQTKEMTKMHTYHRVLARLRNKDNDEVSLLSGFDENGFWLPIPESSTTKAVDYKQNANGRTIQHTLRKVIVQKYIDIEKYRFEAYQEMAQTKPDEPVPLGPDERGLLIHRYGLTMKQINESWREEQITYYDWFCELYFVDSPDCWTYEQWKEYYECCPKEQLPEDFKFIPGYKPGSPECHPEWADYVNKKESYKEMEQQAEAERKSAQYVLNMRGRK